jgi:hypothetical protein
VAAGFFNPLPSPTVATPGTPVFSGASPGAVWTDLDLSGVVGANVATVHLRFLGTDAGGSCTVRTRTNGDTASRGTGVSVSSAPVGNTEAAVLIVVTDAAGVIEWYTSVARTMDVSVSEYHKAAS